VLDWITIKKFCDLTGYSDDAVRSKIQQGIWREDIVWRKAPDGRVLISQMGYDLWAEDRVCEVSDLRASRWTSGGRASGAASGSGSSRPRLISSTPQT
jgi:hypothetical protein